MDDAVENETQNEAQKEAAQEAPAAPVVEAAQLEPEAPKAEPPKSEPAKSEPAKTEPSKQPQPKPEAKPQGQKREERGPRPQQGEQRRGDRREGRGESRGDSRGEQRGDQRGEQRGDRGDSRGERREGGRPGGGRPFEGFADIELEKLISDSLYLDNQAHAVVARMRDMDSGTKSQLRRLYNAVRRAVRAPESERQHQFVMLRARLAYTIARHSLRSLDALERLLLQVTRKNDARGYERFKDLFEAIVAYNE
jgi:CRISPR type III-A-associated protein Csm2